VGALTADAMFGARQNRAEMARSPEGRGRTLGPSGESADGRAQSPLAVAPVVGAVMHVLLVVAVLAIFSGQVRHSGYTPAH
jgi:hypothetical protein